MRMSSNVEFHGYYPRIGHMNDVPERHLIELWDDCRQKNEPNHQAVAPTRVQRCLLMGEGNFMVVALANNRFCFKKGASLVKSIELIN